jgi:hypothetical protein
VKLFRVNINTPYKQRNTGLIPIANGHKKDATRGTPKVKAPALLCWPTTLEADAGDMAVEVELSCQ